MHLFLLGLIIGYSVGVVAGGLVVLDYFFHIFDEIRRLFS